MTRFVLTTINARYSHASLALRYLYANLKELKPQAKILEFSLTGTVSEMASKLLKENPSWIALSVYIWNYHQSEELCSLIKKIHPQIKIVIGGPEVSFEYEGTKLFEMADHLICGEGEVALYELFSGQFHPKVIKAAPLDLTTITLPYDDYSDEDLAHRKISVETSRGCPFGCHFCLSSLDKRVRYFPLDLFLKAMEKLYSRGAKQFRFIDRTFNLDFQKASQILKFFKNFPDIFLHFEMVPERFSDELFSLLDLFPPGSIQVEIGIQSFNEEVSKRIGRLQKNEEIKKNMTRLAQIPSIHIHSDLIWGLPGEDLASMKQSFDELLSLSPDEIQVGILKRLKGSPLSQHTLQWDMIYSENPPYEIIRNKLIDEQTMVRLKRFARYWDIYGNSGRFKNSLPLLWKASSPFEEFLRFSDWLFGRSEKTYRFSQDELFTFLSDYLTTIKKVSTDKIQEDQERTKKAPKGAFNKRQKLHRQ